MPIKIGELAGNSGKSIKFDVEGETVGVTWDPANWTAEVEERLLEVAGEGDDSRPALGLAHLFFTVVTAWSGIVEDDGVTPVPLTLEACKKLPMLFISQTLQKMQEASKPSSEEGKDSGGTSPLTAVPEPAQAGTDGS